jgi:hypothetical protein
MTQQQLYGNEAYPHPCAMPSDLPLCNVQVGYLRWKRDTFDKKDTFPAERKHKERQLRDLSHGPNDIEKVESSIVMAE